jgi:lipopolysaccharide export system permease protein
MLTIIDRYMLRQFIQVLVICLMSLIGLYIVIDAFGHLDRFLDYSEKHDGGLLRVMGIHYAYQAITFFDRTSATMTLIALMFTITWIQRHHEMTALLAAGITRVRVLRPVLIAAIFVGLLASANREFIMPNIREQLATDSRNLGGEQAAAIQSRFDSLTNILIGGDKIVPATKKILKPQFVLPRGLDRYGKQLNAQEAVFLPATENMPSGYLLLGVTQPKPLLKNPSLQLSGGAHAVYTPLDYSWLKEDHVFIPSGVSFEFLAAGSNWIGFASTNEMIQQLRSPSTDLGNDVRVAIHSRIVRPFLDTTLLFLGLPFVITRTNRNPFIAIGLCLCVVTVFMLLQLGCQSLGTKGLLSPALGAWLPLIIFAPVAVYMSDSLKQ